MRRASLLRPSLALLALAACPPPPAADITSFTAAPTMLAAGEPATLTWASTNAPEGCVLTPGSGAVAATGTLTVTPSTTTSYTLRCGAASRSALVTVAQPVRIVTFTADPPSAVIDSPVGLAWTTEGARGCTLNPGALDVLPVDSLVVTPGATTTWTLSCAGFRGPATRALTVTVGPPTNLATPTDIVLTPGDGVLSLTWTQSQGATNVYFAAEPGLTRENVEQRREGVVFRRVISPFEISGLVNGRTYHARLSAIAGSTETDLSTELSATPQDAPPAADPYFREQWHLAQPSGEDLRVAGAWDAGVRGEGVLVSIVDDGVDLAHEDLRQNVATGRSWDYLGNSPVRFAEHGTAVAGLVAARDWNGLGLRGVAPRASLVSFNVLQDLTSDNERDAMVRQQDVVAVSNNSWGDVDDGTGLVTEADPLWLSGVEEGTRLGRGGKGILYFWASGNGADAPTRDLSNYDGQANRRYVFAVSGVDEDGRDTGYAEPGANVLVAAPTGGAGRQLVTTDLTGADGYNTGGSGLEHPDPSYSRTMNGTSGSTPLAAGVGALILQARPTLSWRDVRRVLALSARKVDPTHPDWAVNGAGLHVNHLYGFGMVDATAAVALARTITPVGPEVHVTSPLASVDLAIPDNQPTGVSSTLTVTNSGLGRLEFVEILVTLDHARSGDLGLEVQKAGGARDVLLEPHRCQLDQVTGLEVCSTLTAYPFGSTRHLDEPADGVWTLTVHDERTGTAGSLVSWQLVLHGRP